MACYVLRVKKDTMMLYDGNLKGTINTAACIEGSTMMASYFPLEGGMDHTIACIVFKDGSQFIACIIVKVGKLIGWDGSYNCLYCF